MSEHAVYLVSAPHMSSLPHWFIWVPADPNSVETHGKKIHVVGGPLLGFDIEIVHSADLSRTKFPHKLGYYFLGHTSVANTIISGRYRTTRDLNPLDNFEKKALTVRAPGVAPPGAYPSGKVSEINEALRYDIPALPRCQEWTIDYIRALLKAGYLTDRNTVINALRSAKQANPHPPIDEYYLEGF